MKILKTLCFLFVIVFSTNLFSEELHSQVYLTQESSFVKEGDIVEGVLKIWPIDSADLNEFKTLVGKNLLGHLYVTEIESVAPSENNADVIEVKALFIVNDEKEDVLTQVPYKNQLIPIDPISFKIERLEKKTKDYYILDQSLFKSHLLVILIVIFVGVITIFLGIKRRAILKFIKERKLDPIQVKRNSFNELFAKATTREDFEHLYLVRKEWLSLVEIVPAYQDFFNVMNQHQYKKNWSNEDLIEVQSSFEIIRGSFK
jgi:hypothetical protein